MLLILLVAMECGRTWNRMDSPDPRPQRDADAALLRSAGFLKGESLKDALGRYHLSKSQRADALLWIEHLGSPRFAEREQAQKRLLDAGPPVLPLLRLVRSEHVERSKRLATCLIHLERRFDPALLEAMIRCHAAPTTAPDLWRLLENCPDPAIEEETAGILVRLARSHASVRHLIEKGSKSSFPAQRACAMLLSGAKSWDRLKDCCPDWNLCHSRTDMLEPGPTHRSRQAVVRFLNLTSRGDQAGMLRMSHLPFCLAGRFTLLSVPELEELLTQSLDGLKGKSWSCEVLEAMRLETYAPSADEMNFLQAYPSKDIRVVKTRMHLDASPPEVGYFFVILRPQPQLLGVGAR